MHKVEYEEVLKSVDITSPSYKRKIGPWCNVPVYVYNGFNIYFYHGNVFIDGRIPLNVVDLTKQKHNDICIYKDGVRTRYFIPDEEAVDDKYNKEIKEICRKERYPLISDATTRLKRRSSKNKYLKNLVISRKESFLYFLLQEKDFILRNNKLPETEVNRFNDLLKEVFVNILRRIDPTVSPHAWMIDRSTDSTIYNLCNSRVFDNEHLSIIKDLVNEFDMTINPFINNEIDIEDLLKFDDFYVVGDIGDSHIVNTFNKKDCCEYYIRFGDFHPTYINYKKGDDSFSISIEFYIDDHKIYINHLFNSHLSDSYDNGETIFIVANGDDDYNAEFSLSYNRIRNRSGYNRDPREATTKDYNEIVSYLKLAISYAREKLYNKLYSNPGKKIL